MQKVKKVLAGKERSPYKPRLGGVAEWSIAAVLKTVEHVSVPGVRIPLPPLERPTLKDVGLFFYLKEAMG